MLPGAGFTLRQALDTVNVVAVFTVAHVVSELDTRGSSAAALAAIAQVAGTVPLLACAVTSGSGTDDASRFQFAVDVLCDGLEAALARA